MFIWILMMQQTPFFLKELGFRYQPQFVLIDGEGNIMHQWLGPVSAEDFQAAFDLYTQ